MQYIRKVIISNKEIIMYAIYGGLTTILNIVCYHFFNQILGIDYLISNALAWCCAVIFAYYTNKMFVFESKELSKIKVVKEFVKFLGCRIFTGIVDMILMLSFVSFFEFDKTISKVIDNVIIIILNYVLSKFLIFRKQYKKL